VFSAEGVMIGEFGEERRNLTPIAEIPKVMKDAVLAIEDARFYQHSGVDYRGLLRAALATGCERVNIGTAALENPIWCARAIAEFGSGLGGSELYCSLSISDVFCCSGKPVCLMSGCS
jgi:hypothetical protein